MEKNVAKNALIKSAMTIAVGGFIAKILGALYRLPLTNIIGSYGMGLYQMVFPLYGMLLTLSATGIPSALSKLISGCKEEGEREGIMSVALLIIPLIGGVMSMLMALFAGKISILQGNADAKWCYIFLSPSVFLVSVLAVLRGYFQGRMNMMPTALSQIVEQAVKLGAGLMLCHYLMPSVKAAAVGCCTAVTLSEAVAVIFVYIVYKARVGKKIKFEKKNFSLYGRKIIKTALSMTVISILPPLTGFLTSFYAINVMSGYIADPTGSYGIYSGGVASVISMPVALAYGVAAASLPLICKDSNNRSGKILSAYKYTLFISLPATFFCIFFRREIADVLFFGLSEAEKSLSATLLGINAAAIALISAAQTGSSVVIAKTGAKRAALNLAIGCSIDLAAGFLLMRYAKAGIISLALSQVLCYLVAGILNLVYSIKGEKEKKIKGELAIYFIKATAISASSAIIAKGIMLGNGSVTSLLAGFALTAAVFMAAAYAFNLLGFKELSGIMTRKRKNETDDSGNGLQ